MNETRVDLLLRPQDGADQGDRPIQDRDASGTLSVGPAIDHKITAANLPPVLAIVRLRSGLKLRDDAVLGDGKGWVVFVTHLLAPLSEVVANALHLPMLRHF